MHVSAPQRFIPSSKWKGARRGYRFGRGDRGQGYYCDAAQGERWRETQAKERRRSRSRERSRSRSRERSKRSHDKPAAAAFDGSKLEGSLTRKPASDAGELTEEQRRIAALARLAERRQAGVGAKPGGHSQRW